MWQSYKGDGSKGPFTFTFGVKSVNDVICIVSTGYGDMTLNGADFTVTLNNDQDNNPGGTITLDQVLPVGHYLTAGLVGEIIQTPNSVERRKGAKSDVVERHLKSIEDQYRESVYKTEKIYTECADKLDTFTEEEKKVIIDKLDKVDSDISTMKADSESRLSTLENSIANTESNVNKQLESAQGNIDKELETAKANVDNKIVTFRTAIELNANNIDANKKSIATNATGIKTNATDIDTLEKRTTAVEDRATSLETRTTSLETRADANDTTNADFEKRITTNTTELADHESRISANETTKNNHETRITTAESDIDNLKTRVTTNETSISALDTRVTTTEASIKTNADNISALDTRVTTTEANVTKLDQRVNNIETTTDVGALAAKITSIENKNAEQDTSIKANTDAISTEVSNRSAADTALEGKISDEVIARTNADNALAASVKDDIQPKLDALETKNSEQDTSIKANADAIAENKTACDNANTALDTRVTNIENSYVTLDSEQTVVGVKTFSSVIKAASPSMSSDGTDVATTTWVKSKLLDFIYPVGSIYLSVNNVSPASFLGGTWEALQDRFLIGAGDTYAVNATGGSTTHTLTIAELPSHTHEFSGSSIAAHTHTVNRVVDYTSASNENVCRADSNLNGSYQITSNTTSSAGGSSASGSINSVGSNSAHSIMNPYLAVYMWKRTA